MDGGIAMDYALSRRDDIVARKLSFPGLFPIAELTGALTSGSISASAAVTHKWQASFDYRGDDLRGNDIVQISALFDDGHEQKELPIGTFKVTTSGKSGGVQRFACYSLTKIVDDARYWQPYSVSAESDIFDHIEAILKSVGLRMAYRPDTAHPARTAKSFLPEKFTKLEIINELLSSAGYLAADTDPFGNVIFRKSLPTPKYASTVFEDGSSSIVLPDLEIEQDWSDIANVVVVYCDTADDVVLRAVAVNDDPTDPLSIVARGEVCRIESMSDAESQAVVSDKARSLLAEERSKLEAVTVEHAYIPIGLFDPVRIRLDGMDNVYTVQSIDISLDPGFLTTTRARRFF